MAVTEQRMDVGEWEIALDPGTPTAVLDDLSIFTRLWATYVRTPAHWELGEVSDAELLGQARSCGVLLYQGRNRLGMGGPGLGFWFGGVGQGGNLFTGVDAQTGGLDLEGHLDARVFAFSNGLTKGSINADATPFTHGRESGDTRWEMLHSLARMAPGGPYWFRINPDFSVDVDLAATLWPSNTTPTAILTGEGGGPEADITGLHAILDLEGIDGGEVRTGARIDWNDGTDEGTFTATLPATYGNLDDGNPVHLIYIDWRPKRNRPPTERWRRVAAWSIKAQARANVMAEAEVDEREDVRPEISAALPDITDPWSYDITPGNKVYVDDVASGLTGDTHVPYRGDNYFPTTGRVDEMTVPNYDGGGHYLRCWDGSSAFEWIDLTRYVIPEEGAVELGINQRRSFPLRGRTVQLTRRQRRQWYKRAHEDAQFAKYLDRINNPRIR